MIISYFQEYVLQDVKNRQHLITLHKKSKKLGLDLMRYNQLKDQISSLELDLVRVKKPLLKRPPKNASNTAKPTTDIDNKKASVSE